MQVPSFILPFWRRFLSACAVHSACYTDRPPQQVLVGSLFLPLRWWCCTPAPWPSGWLQPSMLLHKRLYLGPTPTSLDGTGAGHVAAASTYFRLG